MHKELLIDDFPGTQDSNTNNKGKNKFVLLKERSTDILINGSCKELIKIFESVFQNIGFWGFDNGLDKKRKEPSEGILVHGINVSQFCDTEEQN